MSIFNNQDLPVLPEREDAFRKLLVGMVGLAVIICSLVGKHVDSEWPQVEGYNRTGYTWSRTYSLTSCADWNSSMTEDQKIDAGGDLLRALWNRKFPGKTPKVSPSDASQIAYRITNFCTTPGENGYLPDSTFIPGVASLAYLQTGLNP